MIRVDFARVLTDAYGLYDRATIPFGAPSYQTITGQIYLDNVVIGEMTLYEIEGNANIGDIAFQIPGDTAVIAEMLCDAQGNLKTPYKCNNKIVILDKIYIEPEYRNKGYGSSIVKDLDVMLNDVFNHSIDMIILYAGIYDFDEYGEMSTEKFQNLLARLVRFYERSQFCHVGNNILIKQKG